MQCVTEQNRRSLASSAKRISASLLVQADLGTKHFRINKHTIAAQQPSGDYSNPSIKRSVEQGVS
ncbi:hypothetical protein Poly24_28110 [Rosistilla carotiformis]|uniref:Uncharacterized protein n=1 Tax=Rosistilla carotiformis TaxID=2528017 RepID=A0A518JU70_9BACT|nr:hypothetical protein Poly24_28110 [Rosistilla carotiformis]